MQGKELKPCPFCGGVAVFNVSEAFHYNGKVGFRFCVKCSKCGTTKPSTRQNISFEMGSDGRVNLIDDGRGKAAVEWNGRENG